jgi:hypothetical protein
MGTHFGLSRPSVPIDKGAAWGMSAVAVLLVAIELVVAQL